MMTQVLTINPNTSTYTIQDVLNEIKECVSLLNEIGYSELVDNKYSVEFSTKRVKNYATCRKESNKNYVVTVNKYYLELASAESVHNTIMHEVIHSISGCMNHKTKWKEAAAKVNKNYIYTTIQRLGYDQNYHDKYAKAHKREPLADKYLITCSQCGHEWHYKKKTKIIQKIPKGTCSCPYCHSHSFSVLEM